jgi:antitoxin (DNA-binding transcriptional repressor) of toxin-antitoxin stability system
MAETFSIEDAKSLLPELIERAEAGEEILIGDDHGRLVRLIGLPERSDQPRETGEAPFRRKPGMLKGQARVPDSFFFDPLPEDELKLWEGADGDPPR